MKEGIVAHAYNPSYWGSRVGEEPGLRPTQAKS
jgi:hypothetical protein